MISFLFYTLIPLLVGFISSSLTNMDASFIKPLLYPPKILFPIVWTILYLFLGYSSYLVRNDKKSLKLFYINLAINGIWSLVFFNLHNYLQAFILVIVMIILEIFILIRFKKVNNLAFILNIPYLIWLLFASYLSFSIYLLN